MSNKQEATYGPTPDAEQETLRAENERLRGELAEIDARTQGAHGIHRRNWVAERDLKIAEAAVREWEDWSNELAMILPEDAECWPGVNPEGAQESIIEAALRYLVAAEAKVRAVELAPAERMALTVAVAQVSRGESPSPNVAAVCVMALDRIRAVLADVPAGRPHPNCHDDLCAGKTPCLACDEQGNGPWPAEVTPPTGRRAGCACSDLCTCQPGDPTAVQQRDLAEILRALGLGTHARPYSPHEVVQREVLPALARFTEQRAEGGA